MATTKIQLTGAEQVQGVLPVANGGTGDNTLAIHGVLIGNAAGVVTVSAVGTNGQLLTGNTGADPTWQTPVAAPVFVDSEVPAGTINGSNVSFTLANTPTTGSLHLYLNGVRQAPTADYSIATATITMVVAPATNDTLLADYRH